MLAVLVLALSACTGLRSGGRTASPQTAPTSAPAPVPDIKPPSPGPAPPAAADAARPPGNNTAPAAATNSAPASAASQSSGSPPRSKPPAARTAPATQVNTPAAKQPAAGAPAERPSAPPPLDIAALEKRLKDTHAIGVFTKLSLKNQVDDLLAQFNQHYRSNGTPPLSGLRQKYDLLMLKVLSLLQDGDPALAQTIASSREAIWGILNDPAKLKAIS